MATVRCCVWESEINRVAGASWTLWSRNPACATAVPAPWALKGLLLLSSVEGRGWTGETPGKGTTALALGECEDVCREKAGQHNTGTVGSPLLAWGAEQAALCWLNLLVFIWCIQKFLPAWFSLLVSLCGLSALFLLLPIH